MKRITFTFITLFAIAGAAIAAGPVAPREAKEPVGSKDSANPANPAAPAAPTQQSNPATPGSPAQSHPAGQMESGSPAGKPAAKGALSGADQAFIQKAAEMNQYELEMCKAAARISGNPEVRKAAKSMERDLSTVRQQLESLASSKGITLPSSIPQALRDKLTAAESRTASQFDRNYLDDQIAIKQQTIVFFEREGSRTSDADLKAWAQQTIPSLKNHLSILKTTRPPAVGEKSAPAASPKAKQ